MSKRDTMIDLSITVIEALVNRGITKEGSCEVAGGFTRDILLNKEPKDIDIIVRPSIGLRSFSNAVGNLGYKLLGGDSEYEVEDSGFSVYSKTYDGIDVQLIVSTVMPSGFILRSFDFGICMARTTIDGECMVSQAFKEDVYNKHLTLYVRPTMTKAQIGNAIQNHLPRLMEKFPDHTPKIDYRFNKAVLPKEVKHLVTNKAW